MYGYDLDGVPKLEEKRNLNTETLQLKDEIVKSIIEGSMKVRISKETQIIR